VWEPVIAPRCRRRSETTAPGLRKLSATEISAENQVREGQSVCYSGYADDDRKVSVKVARIAITPSVFAVTLSIALVLAGSIIFYSRYQSRQQALVAAAGLMGHTAETIRLRIATHVDPIENLLARARFWQELQAPPTEDGHAVRERMLSLARELPQISSIFVGYDTGDYYLIGSVRHRPKKRLQELGAPDEAAFIEEVILRSDRVGVLLVDRFLGTDGKALTETRATEEDFDPRDRPWFEAALETSGLARTDVYTFVGSENLGFSVSQRAEGAVAGVDITLEELNAFLNAAPQAKDGVLAIYGADKKILAQSRFGGRAIGSGPETLAGMLIGAAQAGRSTSADIVEINGQPWITQTDVADLGGAPPETLLVGMPVATVVAPLQRISRNTLIASALMVLASIPIIWLISRRISRPILRLAGDAERIRRFDLESTGDTNSFIEEVYRLQVAVARMRASLRTFALYVPKALVAQLVEHSDGPELGGTRREITILFMDLENFTAMSAHREPEEVMSRMSRYFEAVTQVLLAHGATIDKYIGDAVMAFWNAPDETADHVALACRAALKVIEAGERETGAWKEPGALPLRTRIGIHTGSAIVGNVGSSDRMNYTALGATVNLAARLEPLNRDLKTDIRVSAAVFQAAGDRFVFESAGRYALKGFDDKIEVFELKKEKGSFPGQGGGSVS